MTRTPDPTHIVADADVLAADVLIDGPAREAMDLIRSHRWLTLLASEPLLDEAADLIGRLGDPSIAADWRDLIGDHCTTVDHPVGDHPAIASAYAGEAGHVLTYDGRLTGAQAGLAVRKAMPMSVRTPEAFLAVVDLAALYEATFEENYPGPDAEPRG